MTQPEWIITQPGWQNSLGGYPLSHVVLFIKLSNFFSMKESHLYSPTPTSTPSHTHNF